MAEEKNGLIQKWMIDINFENIRNQYKLSKNPKDWSLMDVFLWFDWANKQFELGLNQSEWCMTGQQLCALTIDEFRKMVPSDHVNKFWTHLEILRSSGKATIFWSPNESPKVTHECGKLALESTSNRGKNIFIYSFVWFQCLYLNKPTLYEV